MMVGTLEGRDVDGGLWAGDFEGDVGAEGGGGRDVDGRLSLSSLTSLTPCLLVVVVQLDMQRGGHRKQDQQR